MSTRMLIDTRHSEETRVAVVKGSRVEDFDYESVAKKQLKGNIYLARVTRVEPSLQACFVEYGGNRHGFLAFSEIHPDYYQIPSEDREAILAQGDNYYEDDDQDDDLDDAIDAEAKEVTPSDNEGDSEDASPDDSDETIGEDVDDDAVLEEPAVDGVATEDQDAEIVEVDKDTETESLNTEEQTSEDAEKDEDEARELRKRRYFLRTVKRRYKIQEVIKRRQVLLIQVVKEERGNKGAALTTYLSLAGRYCVLMPNSTHSGGISRKISSHNDRRRLKGIITSLRMPNDMGLIVRTAGMKRTKSDIKRDYDYLLRMWNAIRDLTLKSVAPALIYEEGNLIKRAIRDLYNREIDEILVEGRGYRMAKDFMKMLMPSHAAKIKNYTNRIPLFHRYQVEGQLASMYDPVVQLKSGGYIVINPTEALISIDVNSGRATKEKNIEETAVKTNIESAEEVARQLRLRDMAGLVVIDFIDMEDRSNIRSVERRMKEVLKNDRARIQVGKISSFGLMEMSRQRLRPNLLEATMHDCSHCKGSGVVPTTESAALTVLRELEEEGIRSRSSVIRVTLQHEVAAYILNNKRRQLIDLEFLYKYQIQIISRTDLGPSQIEIEREAAKTDEKSTVTADELVSPVSFDSPTSDDTSYSAENEDEDEDTDDKKKAEKSDDKPKRRRRRRRRDRNDDKKDEGSSENNEVTSDEDQDTGKSEASADGDTDGDSEEKPNRRRRGRRGGRRRRRNENADENQTSSDTDNSSDSETVSAEKAESTDQGPDSAEKTEEAKDKKPARRRRPRKRHAPKDNAADEKSSEANTTEEKTSEDKSETEKPAEKKKPRRRTSKPKSDKPKKEDTKSEEAKPVQKSEPKAPTEVPKPSAGSTEVDPNAPKRKGWWQRTFG